MAIIETMDASLFVSRFKDYGRAEQFTYAGLRALFAYLEELSDELGTNIDLDVIGLCCDWSEDTLENALKETGCTDIEEIRDSTTVIEVDDDTILWENTRF